MNDLGSRCRLCCRLRLFKLYLLADDRSFSLTSLVLTSRERCFYDVLGVQRTATQVEIKRAYYEKSKLLHPDTQGSAEAFLELKRAYDILRRPADRRIYDVSGQNRAFNPANRARARQYSQYYNHNFSGQNWDQFYSKHYETTNSATSTAREYRYMKQIMFFMGCGFVFIIIYNFGYWWRLRSHKKYLQALVDKDEIVRSFLRQREHRDKFRDEEEFRQLGQMLWTNIDDAQRRRLEQVDRRNPFEIREESRWFDAVTDPAVAQQRHFSNVDQMENPKDSL